MKLVEREDGVFSGYKKILKAFRQGDQYFTSEINLCNKYERNKTLVLVHGSGGISTEIELWKRIGLYCGWNICITDHFTSREISKLNLDGSDKLICTPIDLAEDLKVLVEDLLLNPNISEIHMVGFSLGATAAMLANSQSILSVHAYYPTVRPVFDSLKNIRTDNLKIIVGSEDGLTPADDIHFLNRKLKGAIHVTVLDGLHHSFMRPSTDIDARVYPISICSKFKNCEVSDEDYKRIFLQESFFEIPKPWPRVKLKGNNDVIKQKICEFFDIADIELLATGFNFNG